MSPILHLFIVILTVLIFIASYAIHEVMTVPQWHQRSIFNKFRPLSFFGKDQWYRKYRKLSDIPLVPAPKTRLGRWYYKFFRIAYHERFPLSTTALVFITDAMHFSQWMILNTFALTLILVVQERSMWNILESFLVLRAAIAVAFSLCFDRILRKD